MPRKIGEHFDANNIRETWWDNGDGNVTVQRHQDAQGAIDLVQAVNAEGAPTIDGLGKPIGEIPLVVAQEWALKRGIPWEKLLYSHEYDHELRALFREYTKLAYVNKKSVHTVQ
jgi:hypothetical protein